MPYRREIVSKAPVFGIVLKLTDAGELQPQDVPDRYWRLLASTDRVDTLCRLAVANNLLLERPHDPGVHRAIEEIFLRPSYRDLLAKVQPPASPHPVFPMAITRLGSLLTIKTPLHRRPVQAVRRFRSGAARAEDSPGAICTGSGCATAAMVRNGRR